MQKENQNKLGGNEGETQVSTSENLPNLGESMPSKSQTADSGEKGCAADSKAEFEKLIKGEYKEAFDERVQGIINKRFKEIKKAEASSLEEANDPKEVKENATPEIKQVDQGDNLKREAEIVAMGYKDFKLEREMENPTFKALISGGVDMLTAYQALHIEEIMDSSVRFGAEKAAKQMADSIRFKVGRPSENGLANKGGFGTRKGVSGLTPKQRKELARKALMGEDVSF